MFKHVLVLLGLVGLAYLGWNTYGEYFWPAKEIIACGLVGGLVAGFIRGMLMFALLSRVPYIIVKLPPIIRHIAVIYFVAAAALFFIIDVIYNWLLTFVFWDPPRSLTETCSYRFGYYLENETGFRLKFAQFMCNFLSRWDENHCVNTVHAPKEENKLVTLLKEAWKF